MCRHLKQKVPGVGSGGYLKNHLLTVKIKGNEK
jgi:hypothetical protein